MLKYIPGEWLVHIYIPGERFVLKYIPGEWLVHEYIPGDRFVVQPLSKEMLSRSRGRTKKIRNQIFFTDLILY